MSIWVPMNQSIPKTSGGGIYAIRHVESGKLYIGSAVNFNRRWRAHRTHLRNGTHHSPYLQNLYAKYGEAGLQFAIVQEIEHKHELVFWEQFWIDRIKPALNLAPIAGSRLGIKATEETKEKMRKVFAGRAPSQKVLDAAIKANTGKARSEETRMKLRAAQTGKKMSDEVRQKMVKSASKSKSWFLISPEGEFVEVFNLNAFCRDRGLTRKNLEQVKAGKRAHHKGWRFADSPSTLENVTSSPLTDVP